MESFHEYMSEYRKQMQKGDIQEAYKRLMKYIMELRLYLQNKYPDKGHTFSAIFKKKVNIR